MAVYKNFGRCVNSNILYKTSLAHRGFGLVKRFLTQNNDKENISSVGETHFGFETVNENEKANKVHEVFEAVANSYDTMNDAMSFGIHRIWKDIFIQRLGPTPGTRLLDVAGGTGDIAFRYLKYLKLGYPNSTDKESHVTVCDINQAMLDVGKARAERLGLSGSQISWLKGDAEKLPVDDSSYTAFTIAFGIRNVTHIEKVLDEAYRVLQPGGRFLCLEFSQLNNQTLQCLSTSRPKRCPLNEC
ncbi:2-methoxy-6-polyprenyl-1,4-benzoquinol methylase, mitochondrial isoform X3 [Anabrus simplex]|uniref:2-methoxy-6-polyprenyl-1,4-benzoquinol methylase, mitochondrial isoform X3 n=1 Tax=Anabrus simplex TaxID=316456 RepID=UPI0035A35DF8